MKIHKPPFLLKEIKIEVTHDCPLACVHCSSDSLPITGRNVDRNKCVELIEQAALMGVKKIAFSGGEPLMCIWLSEAIKKAKQHDMEITIYTSGNVDNAALLLKDLKTNGLNRAIFSLYSDNNTDHDRITRKEGSFEKTLSSIKYAIENKIETEIHFVALSSNYKKVPNVAILTKSLGVKQISILRFVPQGRGTLVANYVLNKEQHLELKKIINDLREQRYDIRTGSPFNFLLVNEEPACYSAIDRMIITPDLRIYPCDAFKQIQAEEICSSLEYSELENFNLSDCWKQSKYFNKVRDYLTTSFFEPCVVCSELDRCLSGCLAQKFIAYADLEKHPDPSCLLNSK